MFYFGQFIFQSLFPPLLVNFIYFSASVFFMLDPGVFSEDIKNAVLPFFASVAIIQSLQIILLPALFLFSMFNKLKLIGKTPDVETVKIYAIIGLIAGGFYLGKHVEDPWQQNLGILFSLGYFFELIFRPRDTTVDNTIFRELIYSSFVTFIGGLFILYILAANSAPGSPSHKDILDRAAIPLLSCFSVAFFGFKIIWLLGLRDFFTTLDLPSVSFNEAADSDRAS